MAEDQNPQLSIIVPVYNERELLSSSLARVVRSLPGTRKELIIVDDGSTDGTREWISETFEVGGEINPATFDIEGNLTKPNAETPSEHDITDVRVFFQEKNQGKGAALRRGFEEASAEGIVIHDADLEYDPADWDTMWRLIHEDIADVVYGSRFYGQPHRSLFFQQYLANRFISFLVSLFTDQKLTDVETCYKMFRSEVLDDIKLTANDFGFEVEFTIKVARKRRWRVYETGISYYGRSYEEGKKINWKDGIKAIWYVFRYRFFA